MARLALNANPAGLRMPAGKVKLHRQTIRFGLPGEAGLARRRQALKDGVELFPGIMTMLDEWAVKFGVQRPSPLN